MPAKTKIDIEVGPDERQLALEYVAEAWNSAEMDGIGGEALAHAGLMTAFALLVNRYGEEAAAQFIATLPDRIRAGEYTLDRPLQ